MRQQLNKGQRLTCWKVQIMYNGYMLRVGIVLVSSLEMSVPSPEVGTFIVYGIYKDGL